MVEGVWVVTSITGPWGEPFLRDVEHDPEDHFDIDWTSINVDDLYPQRRKLLMGWEIQSYETIISISNFSS